MFKGASRRNTGIEQRFEEFRVGQCNPERLQRHWGKVRFCRHHGGLSYIFHFLATGIFKPCLETAHIWPLTLRILSRPGENNIGENMALFRFWQWAERDIKSQIMPWLQPSRTTYTSHPFLLLSSLKRVAEGCKGKKYTKPIYVHIITNYRTVQVDLI